MKKINLKAKISILRCDPIISEASIPQYTICPVHAIFPMSAIVKLILGQHARLPERGDDRRHPERVSAMMSETLICTVL